MRCDLFTACHLHRMVFIAILVGIAISPLMLEAMALPDTVVMVEPSVVSTALGDTFSVNVTVVDVENLYGLDMTLDWDSTVLTLVNVEIQLGQEGGVLNAPLFIIENSTQENKYTVSATSTTPASPFYGTGNIVRLNFSVISADTCELSLQTQLCDYPPPDRDPRLSLPIAHTDVDGFFEGVVPEFPNYAIMLAIAATLTLLSAALSKHISSRHVKTFDKSASNYRQHLAGEKCAQAGA